MGRKTYYVPLTRPGETLNPSEIPLRKHKDWVKATEKISAAKTKKLKKEIAQERGIKGMPALSRVGSLNFARGVPWDFMHLLFENIVKNLFNLT